MATTTTTPEPTTTTPAPSLVQFSSVEVIKTKENFHYIEWDVSVSGGGSVDDYKFQIHWSEDQISGFLPVLDEYGNPVEIDGAIGPLSYTHTRNQYDFSKDTYYKVLAIEKAHTTHQFFSTTTFIGMEFDGIHDTIRYNEEVMYSMYYGEPCLIVKRKSFGARCPTCWSPQRQQRMRTHCDTCHGTGFVTGYYQPIEIQISFDSSPKKQDLQKEWENPYTSQRARLSNYPMVRPKDLIVNKDNNQRYVITHVETTKLPRLSESASRLSRQNYIISQLLTLEELNPNDNEYFLDVDNIPVVPISDEGQTGSTLPFFNDHKPVTVSPPLLVNDQQHVTMLLNQDDFVIQTGGILGLRNGMGSIGRNRHTAGVIFDVPFKVARMMDDGRIEPADSSDLSDMDRIAGIAVEAAAVGMEIPVQSLGRITNSGWNWDLGKAIFFNSDGSLTQTAPASGFWMPIAVPITPETIDIRLQTPIERLDP